MAAILAQSERRMKNALEVRVAHADLVHVLERVADVVHAWPAHADALRHEARASMQVELAHVGRMRRVGDERERIHRSARLKPYWNKPRLVDPPRHLAVPEPRKRAAQPRPVDAVGHAPARAAAAKAHHQAGLALRAAVARREDAKRAG